MGPALTGALIRTEVALGSRWQLLATPVAETAAALVQPPARHVRAHRITLGPRHAGIFTVPDGVVQISSPHIPLATLYPSVTEWLACVLASGSVERPGQGHHPIIDALYRPVDTIGEVTGLQTDVRGGRPPIVG